MTELTYYPGHCHCGSIKLEFHTEWTPADFALRECDCSFCRRHGARTARDPKGQLRLKGQPHWYRFGMATADFLLCPDCGVYLAAVIKDKDKEFATLNVNCLEIAGLLQQPARPVCYQDETVEQRIARRVGSWTPFIHEPV